MELSSENSYTSINNGNVVVKTRSKTKYYPVDIPKLLIIPEIMKVYLHFLCLSFAAFGLGKLTAKFEDIDGNSCCSSVRLVGTTLSNGLGASLGVYKPAICFCATPLVTIRTFLSLFGSPRSCLAFGTPSFVPHC